MDRLSPPTLVVTAVLAGLLFYYVLSLAKRKKLPPGPRRLPVIGNAHQMPTQTPWLVFSEWRKTYGDIIHVDVFGQSFLIVSSLKIAEDLLEKRSSIYSDRPHFVMAGDLIRYDEAFVLQSYGEVWRKQRRFVSHEFNQSMVPRYYELQEAEAIALVHNLIKDPASFISELKLRIGHIICRVTYGYSVQSADDPFLTNPIAAMVNFSKATTPGNFLVDFIPALKHLPRWIPGSGFLKLAEEWNKVMWDAANNPFQWCKNNLVTGKTLMPNLCGTHIEEKGGKMSKEEEMALLWAASNSMDGGLDTSISLAMTFWMAMILNPSIQKKAQAELDAVVGKDRLPMNKDKADLPYIRSIMAEVARWAPPVPLCLPHALRKDDVYEGYDLPKGTSVLPNVWQMLHDPEIYPNPMEFNPDRFNGLDSEMKKATNPIFGFGRRLCPGIHFADGTLFAIIATTLATCDILPGLDEKGNEVLPRYAYTSGTIVFPEPFTMRLKSRSTQAVALLANAATTSDKIEVGT